MGLRPLEICLFFERGDRLYTSESAVYRRHILRYIYGPRAERVKRPFAIFLRNVFLPNSNRRESC